MNTIYKQQSSVRTCNEYRCFLCDTHLQNAQIRAIDQLFYVTPQTKSNQKSSKSLASILSTVLEQDIIESNVHSTVLCKKCQQKCIEFDRILKHLETLREIITNNYNETISKYGFNTVQMQLENNFPNHNNLYAIESVEPAIGEVFNSDNIIESTNLTKSTQVKKVMLIKAENDPNPFFTISDIENGIEDSQNIHTVFLEEMNEGSTELIDNCNSNTNDGMSDEQNSGEQIVITEPLDEDQYQYVFEENSNNGLNDNITIENDENDDEHEINNEYVNIDDGTFQVKSIKNVSNPKSNNTDKPKNLFIRNGKQFQCLLCQSNEIIIYDAKTITIHLKSDHNERIYVCNICGQDFRKRNPFNEHMDEHTAANGAYECEICKAAFTDANKFRLHKKTHNSNMKIWSCKACDKKYSSKNLLDEHMNMHTGERPYKCPHCVKDFASKYTLTAHMKIHYDRKRPFECKECGKSFFSNQNLTCHVRTHAGVKEYECDVCGKKFGSPHNLEVHKIVHTGHKPFICRTCGKAFARRAEIKDHERIHTGERPYKCDMCTSSFAQRSNLMSHKRATHFNDKRYKCETCNRSFKRRRLLEYHIKATHTGERPYKCTQCNSTFVYPEHYKKHIRIHTGIKPFACEVCGKTFNSRDNRNAHRYVHSDKKAYECLVCHQGFMRKPLLYAHMEAQNHLNDKIIVNQPRIPIKKVNNNAVNNPSTSENDEIVYLNLNDDDLLDEDEYATLEEEHIVDDGEITNDDEFIIENQFTDNDTNQSEQSTERVFSKQLHVKHKLAQKQNEFVSMDDNAESGICDNETVTFVETSETEDSLNLEGSWLELPS